MKITNILSEICKKKLIKSKCFSHHTYYSNKYLLGSFLRQFLFYCGLFIYLSFSLPLFLREKDPTFL